MKNSKIIEENRNSIVMLDVIVPGKNNQKKISIRGTGFIISKDGKFITCGHVYKQIPKSELQYLGVKIPSKTDKRGITTYERYDVDLLDIDEKNDVALIKIVSKGKPTFHPIKGLGNSESIKEGDEVIFLGYPLALQLLKMGFGITMSVNQCIISSVKRRSADGSLHFFMIDTHINDGSSGSPVFLRETGKVIGMASAKISAKIPSPRGGMIDVPANMGICRPEKYISSLIKKGK